MEPVAPVSRMSLSCFCIETSPVTFGARWSALLSRATEALTYNDDASKAPPLCSNAIFGSQRFLDSSLHPSTRNGQPPRLHLRRTAEQGVPSTAASRRLGYSDLRATRPLWCIQLSDLYEYPVRAIM